MKIDRARLDTVVPLTVFDYHPKGGTALYDAIGSTIMRLKKQISVVMVIATDGEETASRTFSKERVKLMIETCTAQLGWQFM